MNGKIKSTFEYAVPFIAWAALFTMFAILPHRETNDADSQETGRKNVFVVRGNSMEWIFKDGEEVTTFEKKPAKGDVAVIRTWMENPRYVIKRVMATEWDRIECRESECEVNGEPLKTTLGIPYQLKSEMLEAYLKEYSTVPKNALFVLGNLPNGSRDSTVFGFADVSDVIGIVIR